MRYVKLSLLVLWLGCAHESARPRSTISNVPEAARETIWEHSRGADVRVEREGEDYEATWTENGLERELVVTAKGEIVDEEREVRTQDVPPPVRAGAVKALGNGTIKYVLRGDGRYEAEAVVAGKEHEVVLTVGGDVVNDDDDPDENPDDDIDDDDDADDGHDGDT